MTVCVLFEFKFCFHVMNASFRVELLSVCLRPTSGVRKNFFGRVPVAHQARVQELKGNRKLTSGEMENGKSFRRSIINIHQFYHQIYHLLPRKPIYADIHEFHEAREGRKRFFHPNWAFPFEHRSNSFARIQGQHGLWGIRDGHCKIFVFKICMVAATWTAGRTSCLPSTGWVAVECPC